MGRGEADLFPEFFVEVLDLGFCRLPWICLLWGAEDPLLLT